MEGITYLCRPVLTKAAGGRVNGNIVLFISVEGKKKEKLPGKHCWRTGDIGILFCSLQLFPILLSKKSEVRQRQQ